VDAYYISTTPEPRDLFTRNSGEQVVEVATICPGRILDDAGEAASEGLSRAKNALGELVGWN
jgi:hypothetical protein